MNRYAALLHAEARPTQPARASNVNDAESQASLLITTPGERIERDADKAADRVMQMAEPAFRPAASKAVAGPGGTPLSSPSRRFFEPRFGQDLGHVRIHHGGSANGAARNLGARAFTLGGNIFFRQGDYAPGTAHGDRLLAHELAHSLQPGAETRIARRTLADLPLPTRKSLQISRAAPPTSTVEDWVRDHFGPTAKASTPTGITVEYGAGITEKPLKDGLLGVAQEMMGSVNEDFGPIHKDQPDKTAARMMATLPPNGVIDLALDRRKYGGDHAIYRFTRFTERGEKLLIERTSVIDPAPGGKAVTPPQPTPTKAPTPPTGGGQSFTGAVAIGNVTVTIDQGLGSEAKAVADAVASMPDPVRAKIDGITIKSGGSGSAPRGGAGMYDPATDEVLLFSSLFKASSQRFGTATYLNYAIIHELAHAIDLRPRSQIATNTALANARARRDKKRAEQRQVNPEDSDGIGQKTAKRKEHEKRLEDEIAAINNEITDINANRTSGHSIAGSERGEDTEELTTEFGKAIKADGVTPVTDAKKYNAALATNPNRKLKPRQALSTGLTTYAAADLAEAFAENMAIYLLDEPLLKALRPKTHEYFAKFYPKVQAQPKARKP